MKRGWQMASLAFLAVSAVWMVEALTFRLMDSLGPGPGFFPFCLSLLGGVLSLALFVQVGRGSAVAGSTASVFPPRPAAHRVLGVLAGLVGATALLTPLGFRLTLLLLNAYLLVALGVRTWWLVGVFALVGSFGVFHVFYHWLKVPLPIGILGL